MGRNPSRRRRTRAFFVVVTMTLAMATVNTVIASNASAVGTVLFNNTFADATVDGTGTVTKPTVPSGTNAACLTAKGNASSPPVTSCSGNIDTAPNGKLRLTAATVNQEGGIYGATSFPTSSGLDLTFNSYQWGGTSADGIAFMLAAVDPANPVVPTALGPPGGSLGYSSSSTVAGVTNAYLGVGMDVFGNFSSDSFSGTGCPADIAHFGTAIAGAAVVRGPGNGQVGYCGLATTYAGTVASQLTLHATTRGASVVPVEVLVNPTALSFTSTSGVTVSPGTYKVVFTPISQSAHTLTGTLPSVAAGLYPSASWLDASGVPKQLAFGFVASTGGSTDNHEISNVKALTFNPVPQLAVTTTSYSAANPAPGAPVNYQATASVLSGANETKPISITQTVPTGVVPVGAFGTGWVCQAPIGQTITCTTSASSFTNGTTLPVLNIVATVTGSSVTSTIVQNSSPTTASSADANPGTDSVTTAGTVPAAPTAVAIAPTSGSIAGGNATVLSGTSTVSPTAIEIGTTAEQQSGTSVVLLQCPGAAAPGCFTIVGSTVAISSMPARSSATSVTVSIVTLGIAGSTTYTYLDKPATPAAPTVTAGITSATVTWVAPANNGATITGYKITPYLAGVAQATQTFDASTLTRTLSGLTAGSSYTFTVAAVNAQGTSTASAQSAAVVPYAAPGTPTITAVTAATGSAVLSWSAPSANGSAITGYLVTPYIGVTAQTPQSFNATATTRTITGLTAGTAYTFTVTAQNAVGNGPPSAASAAVTPNVSPSLSFPAPPTGEVGVVYSRQLTVTNGTSPFGWSLSSGALPAGLTLNASTGLLSGTPTASGSFSFVVQVTDASGQTATEAVTLVIAAAPTLTFTPAAGEVGVAYSQQPTLTGGTAPFGWTVTAGSLPAGVTLNSSTGLVSGTPTASSSSGVTITATGALGQAVSKTVTIVIVARPAFTATTPPAGQVGVSYSAALDVTGGSLPLAWSISAGSLPPGLTLNTATGAVTGVPTAIGSYAFTASVVDANAQTVTKSVTLIIGAGPLVITKTANLSSAAAGSTVGYTITVVNSGPTAFTGVTLSDPLSAVLDDAVYNANATASSGATSYSSSTLGWTGTVAGNSSVTVSYSVTVNNPDVGNKILSNTVTSTTLGTNCASGSADSRCSSTVTVPGLTIVKTADVSTTTPGSTVHYGIVVTNTGQSTYSAATLTDSLAGLLDDAAYNADASATSGNLSYTAPALTWTGTLAVGASATITYSATVSNPDTGDRSLTGTVVSSSAGSPCPSGNPAAQCTATVTVLVPALSMVSSADVTSTTPGSAVHYTLTLSNTGQTTYTGASATFDLSQALDAATYNADATASSGSIAYSSSAGTLVWTGNLALGATVTIHASVTAFSGGDNRLTTVTSSSVAGSSCPVGSTNSLCKTDVPVLIPQLEIVNSADVSTTTPGSIVHYTVTATNLGQVAYTGASFSDPLPSILDDATYNADATATVGSVSFVGSSLTWTGNLAIGASATVTFSVTVKNPDPGNRTLTSTVTSTTAGSLCPTSGAGPECTSSVAVLLPALTMVASITPTSTTPGSVVQYSLTVRNTGQTSYTGLPLTLNLVDALDDATYNNNATITTGNLVTNPDGTVYWVLDLAPGASAVGTMSMTVNQPDTGDRSVFITAVSDAAGSPCTTGNRAPACDASAAVQFPGLTITKTADTATVVPGGVVQYTISVVNDGETAYASANVTDDLSSVLSDATYPGDATATIGTLTYVSSVLTWTGALAIGASATVTYSVTVRNPDPGDKVMHNRAESTSAGSNCAVGSTDPRCLSTVVVLVPRLGIVKTANVSTTTPGATITYTVIATNTGQTAYAGATFADSLSGVLDDAAYNADATTTSGTVSYAGSTLTWIGNLAIGAHATITYSVIVHAADGGDNLLTNTIASSTPGNDCPAGITDPDCVDTIPVARLVLTYDALPGTTTPGSTIAVVARYTNAGQVPYTGISVAVLAAGTADDVTAAATQSASSGTLTLSATGITWSGSIPIGGVITLNASMTVQDPDTGDKIITATTVSDVPGSNCPTGATDPRCGYRIDVLVPNLTISKTANTTATVAGGTVGYTITAHNTGQTPYIGAVLTDALAGVLDTATYNADAAASSGVLTYTSPNLTWTGNIAVGATVTITYSAAVASSPGGDKTMINTVSSTVPGNNCPPGGGAAACQSMVVILTPGLTILKTANVANATLGSTVTYTVTVTNSGQTSYAAAAFSDPLTGVLDDATYNADGAATSGTVSYASSTVSWSGALSPGASSTITYSVNITNPATGDRSMVNTVSSSNVGNNCPAGAGDSRCTAAVTVTNSVTLTFTNTSDVTAAARGSVVTYTLTVVNSSTLPVVAANLTEPLSGITDDSTYNADAAATVGAVSYSAPNLTWSGTVPATSTVTITYSVTIHATVTGDQTLAATVTSTSSPTSDNCLSGSSDPRCVNTVLIAALAIQQHYVESSTTPGSLVHLTATFTNTGSMPYVGISISSPSADTVDDAVPSGDEVASSGSLVLSGTAITWTGNIPAGATITVTGTLTVKNPDAGNKLLTGSLTSSALGNNCPSGGTDAACTASLAVLLPGLTITKTADRTFVLPGGTVAYTITIHNTGQTAYTGAIVTDDMVAALDESSYDANGSATSGSLAYAGSILTWTGNLAVGETATITYTLTAAAVDTGDKAMVNIVGSSEVGSTCPPGTGDSACQSTVAVLTPALTITSSTNAGRANPGDVVAYTVTASNTGQTSYPAATLSVSLGNVFDDATFGNDASATSGTVGLAVATLTWTGALSPGQSSTITYSVTVNATSTNYQLGQTVTSTTLGTNCLSGSTDFRCATTVAIAGLRILNSADVTTTMPTGVVYYTVTVTNVGQVPYTDVSVSDAFAGALDDATYNGDATPSAGSLVLNSTAGTIVWTGDLAVGASVTITGSVTVNNPDTGDKTMTTRLSTSAPASLCPIGNTASTCATSVTVLTPGLTISTTPDHSFSTPGGRIGYTVAVTNTGQTAYTAASVTDVLGGILTDANYNGDASTTAGAVALNTAGSSLIWIGNLAVGASVTITFSVTVKNPDLGDHIIVNLIVSDELGSTCPTSNPSPACTASTTVLVPVLDIAVASDRTSTVPGAVVSYTVTISNTGQVAYVGATVTTSLAGVLDDAAYNGDAGAGSGSAAYTAPNLVWTGDVGIGATVVVSYSVTVSQPDAGNRLLATAVNSAAPGSTCGSDPQCANAVTVLVPGLSITTTSNATTATPGDPVTFTLTISNTGQTDYDGLVVTTDLTSVVDDAVLSGHISTSSGVTTYTAPTLSWTGTVDTGDTVTITYTATIKNPDNGDKAMTATGVSAAAGSTCPSGGTDPLCSATVTVLIPALDIQTSAGAPTTTPGGTVTYTVIATNTGQTGFAAATLAASLTGAFPDSIYNADVVASRGTMSYTAPILNWSGALPMGASVTITYSITIRDPDPGDKFLTSQVSSTTPGSTCPVGGTASACSTAVRVLVPALVITQTADRTTVVAGSSVLYTVTLTNTGQTAYAPATFTDSLIGVLDDATYSGDASATAGAVDYANGTLAWTGPIPIGGTATITYSVLTTFPANGDHVMTNRAVSGSPGSTCLTGAESGCGTSVTVLVPALQVSKTADTTQVVAGGSVHYILSATNTGAADYPTVTLTDSLTGVLDDGVYGNDATATSGVVGYANGTIVWTGAVPRGATVQISYSLKVNIVDAGDAVLANRIVSAAVGSSCTATSTNPNCVTSVPVAARSITLSGVTPSFTLTGLPGSTVSQDGAVTMTVTTNSPGGYTVSVLAGSPALIGSTSGNTATIPITSLGVRETGTSAFLPLSQTSQTVYQQDTASSPNGDAVSNDYEVQIPNVPSDTYTTTIDYIASTQ